MKKKSLFANFSLFVICVFGGLFTAISVLGKDVSESSRFDISGTVMDVQDIHQGLDKIEALPLKTEKEFIQALEGVLLPLLPAQEATVIACIGTFTKKTTTDSKGNFKLIGLPRGDCVITAQASSRPTGVKGITRTAIAKKIVKLDFNVSNLKLQLCTDFITIKGQLKDANGNPVPGAKVSAIMDSNMMIYNTTTWSTTSNADGSYEITGIEPMSWVDLSAWFTVGGDPDFLKNAKIYVEANGYVQNKKNIPTVPLVTEDQIYPARQLLKISSLISQRTGGPECKEKERLTIPPSKGNVITDIDIVLKKAGEAGR